MFPIGLACGKPNFSPSTTLSDLLKQSGIKEYKSKKNKKPDGNKKKTKYYYEKYLKKGYQSAINKIQELQSPPKNFLSPIETESLNEEFDVKKDLSKKSLKSKKNKSEEEILASLNFLDDCQRYKKRTSFNDVNKFRLSNYSSYVDKYQNQNVSKEFQASKGGTSKNNVDVEIKLLKDKQNDELSTESAETERFREWTFKNETNDIFWESPTWRKPSAELSSGDISKIGMSYLESINSIARTQCKITSFLDTDKLKNAVKSHEHVLKKKKLQKISGKTEKIYKENQENAKEAPINVTEDLPIVHRNLTKSDQQVKSNTGINSPASIGGKPTHSKPAIKDIRKQPTSRKKCLKNEADAFTETFINGEVINTDVVEELWARTPKKTSENSLTSASSACAPEIDGNRNLDSYKHPSKFMQGEITHVVNKSGAKPQMKTEKSKSTAETLEKSNDMQKKLPNSLQGTSREIKIIQSEVKTPLNKKKQQSSQLPAFFPEDIPKEMNCSLLKKKAKEAEKLPSKAIENWSITNRLEQAFLALVTPTFEDKKKKSAIPSITPNSARSGLRKPQTPENIANKKHARTKSVSVKKDIKDPLNPDSIQTKNNLPTARTSHSSHNKKIQNEKTSALPEKLRGNGQKKNPNPKQLQLNYLKISKITENNIKSKKEKKTYKEQNQNLLKGKTYKEDEKSNTKLSRIPLIPARAEPAEFNLGRKSTFSIIKLTSSKNIIGQPRKSNGCNKSDGNIIICYKKTNKENQQPIEQNVICQPKLSKSNGAEEGIKNTSTIIHKRLTKTSLNTEPSPERETPKNSEEKEYASLKRNSEKLVSVQEKSTERMEEIRLNTSEIKKEYNEPPAQSLSVLKINSSGSNKGKVRAVKKRSILSMHASQICNEPSALQKIQERDAMDVCVFYPNASEQECLGSLNSQITVIITNSKTSVRSTTYVNENIENYSPETRIPTTIAKPQESSDISPECCSGTMFSSVTECRTQPSEPIFEKNTPKKESWERDLSHYHQIVREIISQYNRIGGLLKQSEKVDTLTSESMGSNMKSDTESKLLSLREYRRRIISEYEALPNFEYKSKILENPEGNLNLVEGKRNLSVAKDSETYEDEDVKDRNPNMKKILDSHLYVDPENLTQRIKHNEKLLPKNSSLQEVHLSRNGELRKIANKRLKSFSTKIFLPQYSPAKLCSSQEDSGLEYLSSLSGVGYFKPSETESET